MLTRREFLRVTAKVGAAITVWPSGCTSQAPPPTGVLVNDVHSQLNATRVRRVVRADSLDAIRDTIRKARAEGRALSIAGKRHAMGGQQFGADTILVDMTAMNRVLNFDAEKGEIEVEAGIQWPALIDYLVDTQRGQARQWGIIQKQTGADRLSIGGALAANVHGRGLRLKPIIGDVESFVLVDSEGNLRGCDRHENTELFRLAIGGYGLFGIISSVRLRLAPRRKLERVVEVFNVEDVIPAFEKRIADGFPFGDFQYATDPRSDNFLRKGVFSCYRPIDERMSIPNTQKGLSVEDLKEMTTLAHMDPGQAFAKYAAHYVATSGQIYWSDTHQLSLYIDDYHVWLDKQLGATEKATEMITEIYVPRHALVRFMEDVRKDFRAHRVEIIYGTIRLIERDDESFLAWAKESYACVIFNLHTVHTPQGLKRSARAFRRLIDLAIRYHGGYYLTYHRFATRTQVETCYPQFPEFLRLKRKYDPKERFQSDWYRHYRVMFADVLPPPSDG
ncbi:MAG: FAD-binding oxidoreductase [Nitrospira sp.]|nr:FAD-binding oxidoreductase [Nitrospira sp.]